MKSHLTPESDFPSSTDHCSLITDHSTPPAFAFRSYQRDDLARAALHDGAILGWDPGMGKTMATFSLPFLKNSRFVLIVAPAGLHEQVIDEGREKFGIKVTPLPDQATALRLMHQGILPLPGSQDSTSPPSTPSSADHCSLITDHSAAEPRFFITSYNWLGYNGGDEWQPNEANELLRIRRLTTLRRLTTFPDPHLAADMAGLHWSTKKRTSAWAKLSLPIPSASARHSAATTARIETAFRTAAMLFFPGNHPGDSEVASRWHHIQLAYQELTRPDPKHFEAQLAALATDPAVLQGGAALREIEKGIGTTRDGIKCVFKPTLSSLICGIFDCVICDEAVRLKSGTAYQAQGVLRMDARCRYALTGTPIKNKLPDLFFLASFVTGHTQDAIARWPYGNTTADRHQFSSDFGVLEENLTKQELADEQGKKRPPLKTTAQVCNVHRLWRILGPVLIRRRKDDVPDCDLVSKTIIPIRVMPGTLQKRVYGWHLMNSPEHDSPLASIGAQLQCLRQAALNPHSFKLAAHGGKHGRSSSPWTPKAAGILQLATDLMLQGEQLVIFSPFQDFSDAIAARFTECAIPHLKLDGKITPAKRGSLIKTFKSGQVPILIAGIDSMGEGYSLDNAAHLVLPSLSWAFDSNSQAVERVHRLTSKKPVSIYVMVTKGTIDERLASIWQEKGDASDLALDGRLSTQDREEIDLGALLRDAVKDFDPTAETMDEDEVNIQWDTTLRSALTQSYKTYRLKRPTSPVATTAKPAAAPVRKPSEIQTPPPATAPRPLSLFDIMKNKRTNTPPPAAKPAPVKPEPLRNIIPFPGRLAQVVAANSVPMRKVNLAQLLRQ